jgi:hypothetical protein
MDNINCILDDEMKIKYDNINKKLQKLKADNKTQTQYNIHQHHLKDTII